MRRSVTRNGTRSSCGIAVRQPNRSRLPTERVSLLSLSLPLSCISPARSARNGVARNERDFLSPFSPSYCVSTGASRAIHLSYGEKRAPQRGSGKKKRKRKKARGKGIEKERVDSRCPRRCEIVWLESRVFLFPFFFFAYYRVCSARVTSTRVCACALCL